MCLPHLELEFFRYNDDFFCSNVCFSEDYCYFCIFVRKKLAIAREVMSQLTGDGFCSTIIDYLLSGNESSISLFASDVDEDDMVGISDVTALIDYLLSGNWPN